MNKYRHVTTKDSDGNCICSMVEGDEGVLWVRYSDLEALAAEWRERASKTNRLTGIRGSQLRLCANELVGKRDE